MTATAQRPALADGTTIDLTDVGLFASGRAHEAWRVLRDSAPVYWNPDGGRGGGFWALTRYADLVDAYGDPETFSSQYGTVLGGSFRSERDTASGQMIICADPPRHRLLRQQVHRGFERHMVERIRGRLRSDIAAALDRVLADGGCDLATDLAPVLPLSVLGVMFGLDPDDGRQLLDLSRAIIGYRDANAAPDPEAEQLRLATAHARMLDFLIRVIEQRRAHPRDDLPSMLLASTINDRPMPLEAILYNCLNVVVGGNETTPYTACAGVEALIEHPDEEADLHANPQILPSAVDEILRWTSTNAYVGRTVTRDIELHGCLLRAGQRITMWNASANRDERAFPDPDRFDLRRHPNHHLAFGAGPHRCIGQYVAREEVAALFGALAARRIRFELAGPIVRLSSNFMQGITSMPVRVGQVGS